MEEFSEGRESLSFLMARHGEVQSCRGAAERRGTEAASCSSDKPMAGWRREKSSSTESTKTEAEEMAHSDRQAAVTLAGGGRQQCGLLVSAVDLLRGAPRV